MLIAITLNNARFQVRKTKKTVYRVGQKWYYLLYTL